MEILLSTDEVAAFAQISVRQLQWWDERSILKPYSSGHHQRRYTLQQASAARAVGDLRRKHLAQKTIRNAARLLEKSHARFLYVLLPGARVGLADEISRVMKAIGEASRGGYLVEIVAPGEADLRAARAASLMSRQRRTAARHESRLEQSKAAAARW